jgi:hypothetical protein
MRHLPFIALIAYALHGVGVCCDDFSGIVIFDASRPVDEWLATPLLIATHGLAYRWLGFGSFWLYDVLKIGWIALAYALVYRFGTLWFTPARAALFAALFIFYPAHDSTNFWFSNQYLTLTSAFLLLAFYLAERGRLAGAAAMSALGSFESYGSPPWVIGLALVFLLRRKFREAAALLVPQVIYVAYYVALTELHGRGSKRLPEAWNIEAIAKQFLLQVGGGLDAVLGPSIVLKVWWSIASLTAVSAVVGAALWFLIVRDRPAPAPPRIPAAVWTGVLAIVACGYGIFALTGTYPQSAFGMGNRVTIYASFAVAFALAAVPLPRVVHAALAGVLVFATLGISDHWRSWREVQDRTVAAIAANPRLASGDLGADTVFVVGGDYSRLGPFAHIAFFTETWAADALFKLALGEKKTFPVVPLTARFRATAQGLQDTRQGAIYPVGERIAVYRVDTNTLTSVERSEVGRLVESLEWPPRHWIHLVDVPWLRALILRWMPQLGYLFMDKSKLPP